MEATVLGEPMFIDTTGADYADEPHRLLNAARERHPLARTATGFEVLRHDDVQRALQDQRLRPAGLEMLHQQGITQGPLHDWWGLLMFHHEPPAHTRLRSLVSRALTPRRVEAFRPRLREIANGYVSAAVATPEVDVIASFAHPLPIVATCAMLGIPTEAHHDVGEWTLTVGRGFSPALTPTTLAEVESALSNLNAYVTDLIVERRRRPQTDLLQALIDAEDGTDRLTHDELVALVVDLLFSGHDTTKSLLSIGVWLLASHPDQAQLVRRDPALVTGLIEETLRYESPILATPREALVDVEIAGTVITTGSLVGLSIASANRDPRRFSEPDRFDVTRADNRPLSFGQGIHFCIGAAFARAEAQEAFRALLTRTARIEALADRPGWAPLEGVRRIATLPVRLEARASRDGDDV
jgi:pimeloyl-[acyl-carrier protein] synthase